MRGFSASGALFGSVFCGIALALAQSGVAHTIAVRGSFHAMPASHPIAVVVPRGGLSLRATPDAQLTYGGGPVLVKPHLYVVFWGFAKAGDPANVLPLMKSYYMRLGGSPLENILTQYYGPGHRFISNKRGWLKGTWEDDTNPIPASPTDKQVAAEALNLMKHFGGFDPNGAYIVQTAHNHNTQGFGSVFCGYHGDATAGSNVLPYTNLGYMPDAAANCGANVVAPPSDETGADEGATIVAGAELNDLITDPQPPSGWTVSGSKISSLCAWNNIQNDPFRTKSYTSQPELDNKTGACAHSGP